MNEVYLTIRKTPEGHASVSSNGTSAELAGLAVNGVRHIAQEHPEHAGDMKSMIEKDFRKNNESFADALFRAVCSILLIIGLVIVLLALGYGLHCMGLFALHWLEKAEAAVTAWLVAL